MKRYMKPITFLCLLLCLLSSVPAQQLQTLEDTDSFKQRRVKTNANFSSLLDRITANTALISGKENQLTFTGTLSRIGDTVSCQACVDLSSTQSLSGKTFVAPKIQSYSRSGLPAVGEGGLAVLNQGVRGLWMKSASGDWFSLAGERVNVKEFGAKGDGKIVADAACTAASPTVTSASGGFTPAITGMKFDLNNAGAQTSLSAKIVSVTNSTTVVLDQAASYTVSGKNFELDGLVLTDGAMTAGSTTFSSATAAFTSADVGKIIHKLVDAGAKNITGVLTYVNSTTATMSVSASVTGTNRILTFGTDDSPAIAAAFSAGSHIHFPPGIYVDGSQLNITTSNKLITGAGMGATKVISVGPIMLDNASDFHVLKITGASHINISDITFSGTNWRTQTTSFGTTTSDGVYIGDSFCTDINFTRVGFNNTWGIGSHAPGAGFPTQVSYQLCRAEGNSYDGLNPNVGSGLLVQGCWLIGNGTGGIEASTSRAGINGNYIYYNVSTGASVGGFGNPDIASAISFVGNTIEFNGGFGVYSASNQTTMTMSGNTIRRNGLGGIDCVDDVVGTLGKRNFIAGNTISSNGRLQSSVFGVGVSLGQPETTVQNNKLTDEGLTGYQQDGGVIIYAADCRVWDNDSLGNVQQDYNFNGGAGTIYFSQKHVTAVVFDGGGNTIIYPTEQFAAIRFSNAAQTLKPGAASGSNQAGVPMTLSGGQSTGTGLGGPVVIQTSTVGSSGSSVNDLIGRQVIGARKNVATNNAALSLFSLDVPSVGAVAGVIHYTLFCSDGTEVQIRSGEIQYTARNKAGDVFSATNVFHENANTTTGTLTATFSVSSFVVQVTPNSSLATPTTYYIVFEIKNLSERGITLM